MTYDDRHIDADYDARQAWLDDQDDVEYADELDEPDDDPTE